MRIVPPRVKVAAAVIGSSDARQANETGWRVDAKPATHASKESLEHHDYRQ
ncbi:hypothetical protein QZM19_06350 [Burkholderia multivorans]|uniref:hypothetical protein n=1 Tax=Burkholderia multivorans TaxID=87883 RepID=UPI0015E48D78|nr:hypothetical protein [Burkholderia multivorans]MBU9612257.1 hypothetical protein [Burkholderia multivorans]MDN7863009.1 hypothetical protein [Burkholderia multivorans]